MFACLLQNMCHSIDNQSDRLSKLGNFSELFGSFAQSNDSGKTLSPEFRSKKTGVKDPDTKFKACGST